MWTRPSNPGGASSDAPSLGDDSGRLATIILLLRDPPGGGTHRRIAGLSVAIVGPASITRWHRAAPGDVEGIAWVRVRELKQTIAGLHGDGCVIELQADAT